MIMQPVTEFLNRWLSAAGLSPAAVIIVKTIILLTLALLIALLVDALARRLLLGWVDTITQKTRSKFDDALRETRFFSSIAHLAPLVMLQYVLPLAFVDFPVLQPLVNKLLEVLIIAGVLLVIISFLRGVGAYARQVPNLKDKPIDSYVQLGLIITIGIGAIFILSILLGKSLPYLFGTLGAASAILLLIFKDSILGFVASIQVSANDTVRIGDWIEMPQYGADGEVFEINLTTVKVRNWDKTITTIPTYRLISDSFKNWRGMTEAGGRRIKRALYFNADSFKFLDEDLLNRLRKVPLLTEYLEKKEKEIAEHNAARAAGKTEVKFFRHLTNIGTFRVYAHAYLRNHPRINQALTLLVRQLQPQEYGLPLEIYCFTNTTAWAEYEDIQADIFDHLLTIAPLFDLAVFQRPSGRDIRHLAGGSLPVNRN